MAKSDKERKAAQRARRKDEGWMAFEVWVHLEDWPKVKRYLDRLNKARGGYPGFSDNQTGDK